MKSQAFSEVYDIVQYFEPNLYNKIPQKIIDLIRNNKDDNYIPNIDYSKSINEQKLLKETKAILSVIYRDYICKEDLKNKLKAYDYKKLEENKNDYDVFLRKCKNTIGGEQEQTKNIAMVEYIKDRFFIKLFKQLKKIFKRKI